MKKTLIHVGFISGIVVLILLGAAALYVDAYGISFLSYLAACILGYGYTKTVTAIQPASCRVKVTLMPMSEFQQKYGGKFTVHNAATGETITTPPTAWWDGVHEMD